MENNDPHAECRGEIEELRSKLELTEGLVENMAEELERKDKIIDDLIEENRIFEAQSERDKLTGLYNRRGLDNQFKRLESRLIPPNADLVREEGGIYHICLLLLDIDHFKAVNDRFGHRVGDEVLKIVAQRLIGDLLFGHPLRADDIVARRGGEEFAVVLTGSSLEKIQEKLMLADRKTFRPLEVVAKVDGEVISVTFSGGLTAFRFGEDFEEVTVPRADEALYAAKHRGRNQIRVK